MKKTYELKKYNIRSKKEFKNIFIEKVLNFCGFTPKELNEIVGKKY